jgi:hypothetical protein
VAQVLASSDTNIYKIQLDSALAQALQFVRVGTLDVAYMDAIIDCSQVDGQVQCTVCVCVCARARARKCTCRIG